MCINNSYNILVISIILFCEVAKCTQTWEHKIIISPYIQSKKYSKNNAEPLQAQSQASLAFSDSNSQRDSEEKVVKDFKIGALFTEEGTLEEIALKQAVERYNILNEDLGFRFIAQIDYIPQSSYFATPKACGILQEGVVAIFGPQSHDTASHVQSICDAFEIPHIETRWDHQIRRDSYLVNLAPHPETLARAYADLVENQEWDKFLVIYDDRDGLFKLQGVLKYSVPPETKSFLVQLPWGDDYRPFLYELLDKKEFTKIVLDCEPKKTYNFLKQAQQVGLLNSEISFILTSLDMFTVDLEDFKYSRASILAFSLMDPKQGVMQDIIKNWQPFVSGSENENEAKGEEDPETSNDQLMSAIPTMKHHVGDHINVTEPRPGKRRNKIARAGRVSRQIHSKKCFRKAQSSNLKCRSKREETGENADDKTDWSERLPEYFTTEIALIFDAVDLLGHAINSLNSIQEVQIQNLNCEGSNSWAQGYSVINYMKIAKLNGLTNMIHFNTTGFRTDIALDVLELKDSGLEKVGSWNTKFVNKFIWIDGRPNRAEPPTLPPNVVNGRPSLKGKTIVVTTILTAPLSMYKISEAPLEGNDRFEGFAIDLLHTLSEFLGFNYIIKPVNDGKYGSPNKKGEWNGMIREVMDGVADIAVADLTINKMRQGAVAFTMPFMSLGISILYVSPKVKPPSLLSFMAPMGVEVWLYVVMALIGTSITLFICARLTPYEWNVAHPCIDDPDELENEFTLKNCFFFTLGTYLCQGADIAPKTASTRMIAGFWWLFTLIMVSSYTANLATFLIVQDLDESIKSLADLPKQTKARYGCLGSGTTATFFRTSPFETHQQIWKNMVEWSKTDNVFLSSNKAGVDRVVRDAGAFVFFMESTSIEYNTERNCKLAQVGGLLDNKGFGIALKKGSNYTQLFNSGILKLQETGVLDELKRKWWKEERKENACAEEPEEEEGSVKPLKLANVGGVFIVLIVGCIIASFISCVELIFSAKELSEESNESFCTELANELRFVFACSGSVKEVRKKPETSSEPDEEEGSSKDDGSDAKEQSRKSCSGSENSSKEKDALISGSLQISLKNK